jgi:diketogulonate reductase-like aldo/keto reductase
MERRKQGIPRSATPERIRSNLDIYRFELSGDDMAHLDPLQRHS